KDPRAPRIGRAASVVKLHFGTRAAPRPTLLFHPSSPATGDPDVDSGFPLKGMSAEACSHCRRARYIGSYTLSVVLFLRLHPIMPLVRRSSARRWRPMPRLHWRKRLRRWPRPATTPHLARHERNMI